VYRSALRQWSASARVEPRVAFPIDAARSVDAILLGVPIAVGVSAALGSVEAIRVRREQAAAGSATLGGFEASLGISFGVRWTLTGG
jgi:hypothetical protein